jgi:hypothetical protein
MLLSALTGLSRDVAHNPAAPLLFGGALLFIAFIILGVFRAVRARSIGLSSTVADRQVERKSSNLVR